MAISLSTERKLLLSRFLTRSGDQAWDFVIPFALLHLFPGRLQVAAFYYLTIKVGTFLLMTSVGKWMDSSDQGRIVKAGIWFQFLAVLGGVICFWHLDKNLNLERAFSNYVVLAFFSMLCFFGILASLGSVVTEIAVGNDLAPRLVAGERLTWFNSWLRRVDLGTEVGAPIFAGFIYSLFSASHLWGLLFIALWNLISFVPEYLLLKNVIEGARFTKKGFQESPSWKELLQLDFKKAFANPIFPLMFSYALLWLSVLSPHGVLLVGYLKDHVELPEAQIGLFRGLGAVFGLLSTISFPLLVKKMGLIKSSRAHLAFQGFVLLLGVIAFNTPGIYSVYLFLGCILFSRIGLYGFSNGEFELRQRLIPEIKRGELNSLSYLMTTFATLVLFVMGSLLPNTQDFKYLVYISLFAVLLANFVFIKWAEKNKTIQTR